MSKRTAGFVLGGILAVAIGGGMLLLRGASAANTAASSPTARPTRPAPSPSTQPSPPAHHGPVTVEGIVRVQPLSGWRVRELFLQHNPPYLRLVKHQVRMNILAGTFAGSVGQLGDEYATQFVLPFATGSARTPARNWVTLPSGAVAMRLTYSGPFAPNGTDLVHVLTVVMHGTRGVVFDTWATPSLLAGAQPELEQMIDRAVVS